MMGQQEFCQEKSFIVILKGSTEVTDIVNLEHQIQESEIEKISSRDEQPIHLKQQEEVTFHDFYDLWLHI
jgi:hypothetical protein